MMGRKRKLEGDPVKGDELFNQLEATLKAQPPDRQEAFMNLANQLADERDLDSVRAWIEHNPEMRALTLDEIAEVFNIGKRTLVRYVANGDLHAVRVGRHLRVTLAEMRRFLNGWPRSR